MKVELTEAEKSSPYYKYFIRETKNAPLEKYEQLLKGPSDPGIMLKAQDLNNLFDSGYLPGEFGYCRMKDGSIAVANLTDMPGVTPEMFDWWFAWHGLDPMRYKIWDPDDHYFCRSRNIEQAKNENLTMKERYWNTVHDVIEDATGSEDIGGKSKKSKISIPFRNPADIGFDKKKLASFDGTIVCAANETSPNIMCHFARRTENGCELRTRFWLGYCVRDSHPVKCKMPPARVIPLSLAKGLLAHNLKEFTNLAAILPEVYAEFKDQF